MKDQKINTFITHLVSECRIKGVKLILLPEKHVTISKNVKCRGTFEDNPPTLTVAMGDDISIWLPIMVHESCHLDQWYEKIKIWKKSNLSTIDDWLHGKNFSEKKLEYAFKLTKEVELDCEKRALKKIKKFKLPIDSTIYIQKANAYLLFYNYCKKVRKWSKPKYSPYGDIIYPHMPKKWLKSYDNLPENIEKIFDKHLHIK